MTVAKKINRKKPAGEAEVETVIAPEPWLYTINIPIKQAVTLKEPTAEEPGFGLFFLDDGSVRWSIVTLNPNADDAA
jgi:hypothetical protein